jgi:homoserine kinase
MRVRVPASSANLGPGFDAVGLALGLYLTCTFERAEQLTIRASGRDADRIPTSEENLIWQTALRVAQDVGEPLPILTMTFPSKKAWARAPRR